MQTDLTKRLQQMIVLILADKLMTEDFPPQISKKEMAINKFDKNHNSKMTDDDLLTRIIENIPNQEYKDLKIIFMRQQASTAIETKALPRWPGPKVPGQSSRGVAEPKA